MSAIKQKFNRIISGEDITLQELLKPLAVLKPRLKKILIILLVPVFVFGFIGYVAKKTSPKEFEAKCVLLTDQAVPLPGQANNSLAALAVLTGGGTGTAPNNAGSDLYQLILSNRPFLIELSEKQVFSPELQKKLTLRQYFKKDPKKDAVSAFFEKVQKLPSRLFGGSDKDDIDNESDSSSRMKFLSDSLNASFSNKVYVSELDVFQQRIIGILGGRIKFKQEGRLITLSVKMPEARVSAEAAKIVLNQLVEYATRFKVGKQLEDVRFLEARTAEAEVRYKESQQRVAAFKDNNYNVIFESVQSREKQLENNFVLYSTMYNQLVTQLEQAKIQLKKETPLFSVVEPVYIPAGTASDNAVIFAYLSKGFLVGLLIIAVYIFRIFRKEKRNEPTA